MTNIGKNDRNCLCSGTGKNKSKYNSKFTAINVPFGDWEKIPRL